MKQGGGEVPGRVSTNRSMLTPWIWTLVVEGPVTRHGKPVAVTVAVQSEFVPVAVQPVDVARDSQHASARDVGDELRLSTRRGDGTVKGRGESER